MSPLGGFIVRTVITILCVLSALLVAADQQSPPLAGDLLLQEGIARFRDGDYLGASEKLKASTEEFLSTEQMQRYVDSGKIDTLARFETALVYLTVAEARLGRPDEARGAILRLVTAERIEPNFATLPLDPEVAEFQDLARELLPAMPLPVNARLASARPPTAPQIAETRPPLPQPAPAAPPPAQPPAMAMTTPAPVPRPAPPPPAPAPARREVMTAEQQPVQRPQPQPQPQQPPPARIAQPAATPAATPAARADLRGYLVAVQQAAEQNNRESFQMALAGVKRALAVAPGETTAIAELVAVYDDLDRVWDYQYASTTGSFFDETADGGALISMMRKYPEYGPYVRDEILEIGNRRIYPAVETRAFLTNEARRRLNRMGMRTPLQAEAGAEEQRVTVEPLQPATSRTPTVTKQPTQPVTRTAQKQPPRARKKKE